MDPFDPHSYGEDHPLAPLAAVLREGSLALEELEEADSFIATAQVIGAMDDRARRAALLMATVMVRRAKGMDDAEFERWACKDIPPKDGS